MPSIVEFIVKVKDLASSGVAQLANNANASFNAMNAGINRVSGNMNSLGMSIGDINRKINDLRRTREISLDGRQIRRINQEITELERRRNRLEGNSGGGGMGGLRGIAAGAMAFAGIAGIGSVIGKGMDMQMASKSYEIVAGKHQGGAIFNDLQKYAQDSIYGNEVLDVGKTMLSFGVEAGTVGSAVKRLGDIANGNADRMKQLGLAFSQVKAAGRLMGQDVLQFVNAGFNPLQAIAKKTGKSIATLKKEMEDGKISFNDVAGAIQVATDKGGMFYNMAKQLGETAPGKLMALSGAFDVLQAKMGSSMLEMMVPLIDFGNWLISSPDLLAGLASALGGAALAFSLYSTWIHWATIKAAIFNVVAFWPLAVIGALIGAIGFLVIKYGSWGKAMQALWIVIKAISHLIWLSFADMFEQINYLAGDFLLRINNVFEYIARVIGNVLKALYLASQFKFADAKQALFTKITTSTSSMIDNWTKDRKQQISSNQYQMGQDMLHIGRVFTPKKGKTLGDTALGSILDNTKAGGGLTTPDSLVKSNAGIIGGGVRNLTININKGFTEKLEVHTTNLKEGIKDIEAQFTEMFLRVVNSGNAATG